MGAIVIDVLGTPAPKGSSRAMIRGGRAVNVPGGSDVNRMAIRSWSSAVAYAAHETMLGRAIFIGVPLSVEIEFRLIRPIGHYGSRGTLRPTAPIAPAVKPDLDKLLRCTLDALEGIVFDGDSRIVAIHARKIYTPARESPGARLIVEELTAQTVLALASCVRENQTRL